MPQIPYLIAVTGSNASNWVKVTNRTTGATLVNYTDSSSQIVFDIANMSGENYTNGDIIEIKEVGLVNGETTHTVDTSVGVGMVAMSSTSQSSEGFSL